MNLNLLTDHERLLLKGIDKEELTALLQRIVQVNTENPPGREQAVGEMIAETLQAEGCRVELQMVEGIRFNVIATLDGTRPEKLLFNGHLDTVPAGNLGLWTDDPWGAVIRDGRLYGLGSADMKAGLAAMIMAIKALCRSGITFERGLLFTAVIDEEVGFKGTRALLEANKLKHCTMAYVSEPTGLRIGSQLKGALEYTAKTFGLSAHTGNAFAGDNAIYKMGRYLEVLRKYNDSLKDRMDLPGLRYPTVNAGKLQGGVGVTLVPDRCELEFDRQVLPTETMEEAEREIRELTESFTREEGIEVELTLRQRFSNWTVDKSEEVVHALTTTIADLTGHAAEFMGFNGYAEVEMLAAAGIPSVLYGPGTLDVAHAPNEFVPLDEVLVAAQAYALIAYRYVTRTE
jgi:succinyl-diaminopimelate desuccinylase